MNFWQDKPQGNSWYQVTLLGIVSGWVFLALVLILNLIVANGRRVEVSEPVTENIKSQSTLVIYAHPNF